MWICADAYICNHFFVMPLLAILVGYIGLVILLSNSIMNLGKLVGLVD